MKRPASSPRRHQATGAALVIVLAFVVLLTALVVSYFSRTMTDRQLSNTSFNFAKADELAASAAGVIIGDIKQEIVNGSVPPGANPSEPRLYMPTTSADLVPKRTAPASIPNLVRVSSNIAPPAPATGARASALSSAPSGTSVKRGEVTLARWNKHYLVPRVTGANPTDATPVSDFDAPRWIFVTEQGPRNNFAAGAPGVVGRYAYAVYDVGGLLDVNVAGFPDNPAAPKELSARKAALSYADLTQLGLSPGAVNDLVGWRNYATGQPGGVFKSFTFDTASQANKYDDYVTRNTQGFLRVSETTFNGRTDQAFLSRQQLVSYARISVWGGDMSALQYLTTFARSLNAPNWSPATPTGSNTDYAAQKDAPASANRDLLNLRVTGAFVRDDGTSAKTGEPLLKRRFPLSRLSALGADGVTPGSTTFVGGQIAPATAATVQRDFGLVWKLDHWEYCGPTGDTVQTSIAVLGTIGDRPPNFFELLKAGMLSGSLGKDAGDNGKYFENWEEGPASGLQSDDQNVDHQIVRIGANIIDQYDQDSYPTEIRFRDMTFYGIENLPYLQRVIGKTAHPDPNTNEDYIVGWYMAELWNPHQNVNVINPPTEFRLRGEGLSTVWTPKAGGGDEPGELIPLPQSGHIDFTATAADVREPTLLSSDNGYRNLNPTAVVSGSNGANTAWGGAVAGLYAGRVRPVANYRGGGVSPQNCDILLDYKAPSGAYRTYQRMKNFIGKQHSRVDESALYYQHPDPRTDRFGTSLGIWAYSPRNHEPGKSTRPDTGNGWNSYDYHPRESAGFRYKNSSSATIWNSFFLGSLSDNTASSDPYYADTDGVVRTAAGTYSTGTPARPLIEGNTDSRPVILNRPFRNVGELGYAFRDLPWKNIDFFTANSADSGLLDIFCAQEVVNDRGVTAGKVNVNTRQPSVLKAIFAGAMEAEATTATMAAPEASTVAEDLVAFTTGSGAGQGPFANRGELVTRAAALLKGSDPVQDFQIKARREAALRALAEVGDTRTWNLMIDVIAQPGRFPPGVTDLTKFVVEGEKRYWVHVAIDRFTGDVIDQLVEHVYE